MKNNKPRLTWHPTYKLWTCRIRCEVSGDFIGAGLSWEKAMADAINEYQKFASICNIDLENTAPGFKACLKIMGYPSVNLVYTERENPYPRFHEPIVRIRECTDHCKATSNLPWWKRLFRL